MTEKKNLNCSFCGKARDTVEKLIAGPGVYICNECITLSYNILSTDKSKKTSELDESADVLTPTQIKSFLDEYIIGHDSAKELLSVSAYNHYKRISFLDQEQEDDTVIEKSNILLVGPTGSGKTLFAKTLAKTLGVPFAIADATTLTEAGYVGEDVESVIERLLSLADYDVDLAQRGIVYIDEVDKKARRSETNVATRDVSGEGVQQALLRLIEGTVTKVKVSNGKKYAEEYIEFDTSNVLFILGGAFVGIEKLIEKRLKKKSSIGFGSTVVDKANKEKLLKNITTEDIVEYGLIPELVGRLPIIAALDKLSEDQLVYVMTSVKNSIISQVKKLISVDNIELEFGDEYFKSVAKISSTQNLGARSIKSLIEYSVTSIMYRAPDLQKNNVVKIIFDNYPIAKDVKPKLVFADGSIVEDTEYKTYRGINEKVE